MVADDQEKGQTDLIWLKRYTLQLCQWLPQQEIALALFYLIRGSLFWTLFLYYLITRVTPKYFCS